MALAFMQDAISKVVERNFGSDGLGLQAAVPEKESRIYVIPFGGLNDESAETSKNYAGKQYTGADVPAYTTAKLWLRTADLTSNAKEALRVGDGTSFSRLFIVPTRDVGDTTVRWYHDLGYVDTKSEENDMLASRKLTEESWKRVYPHLSLYPGNSVLPQAWHNLPMVEVTIPNDDSPISVESLVWLKLKAKPNRGQMVAFLEAFGGLKLAKDYRLKGKMLQISNSGSGAQRYKFLKLDDKFPDERESEIDGYRVQVETAIEALFNAIYTSNHSSDLMNEDAVRNYLVSITRFDTWQEFVDAYSILATPTDVSMLTEVANLSDDFKK